MKDFEHFFDNRISQGKYQILIAICSVMVKIACGGYLYVMNVVPFYIQRDFFLTDGQLNALITSYQVGQLVGGLLVGQLLDRLGRSPSIKGGLFITLCSFAILLLPFQLAIMMSLAVVLGGFSSFTISSFNTLISELFPSTKRGFWLVVVATGLSCGRLVGALAIALLLAPYQFEFWKKALFTPAYLLLVPFFVFVFYLRESIKFLYCKGRYSDMHVVIEDIEAINALETESEAVYQPFIPREEIDQLKKGRLTEEAGSAGSRIPGFFSAKFAYTTIVTFLNFSIFFVLMNGHILMLPKFVGIDTKSLWTSAFIISGELVASFLCMWLITLPFLGGKRIIVGGATLTCLLFGSVKFVPPEYLSYVLFAIRVCLKSTLVGWSVYTAEAFPILKKGKAFGIAVSCGGLCSAFFPTLFFFLFNWEKYSVTWVMSGLAAVTAIMSSFLATDHDAKLRANSTD